MLAGILPISGIAVGVYFALLVAVFFVGTSTEKPVRDMAWKVMSILAGAIAGSAVWFTFVQKWFIGAFCPYCMSTHATGFLLSIIIVWRAGKELRQTKSDVSQENQKKNKLKTSGLLMPLAGLCLAGLLAAFQVVFTPSSVYHGGESKNNKSTIDYSTAPMIGSPNAPIIVNLLFDYKCPHCQQLHFMLNDVVEHYAGKLAFAICPVPLNPHCNPYIPQEAEAFKNSCELAKIGMAVWRINPEAFRDFEDWMFTFDSGNRWTPRSLEATEAKAAELIGKQKLDEAIKDPWIDRYIQTCVQIYGQTLENEKGGVPRMVFGSRWVIPKVYSADELITIIQESLGVPKP